jgi:ribosomal protein S18 acetylase RimI-like enzyme
MPTRGALSILCRPMARRELPAVAAMVRQVFDRFVAPAYTTAGRRSFLAYARPVRIGDRLEQDHRVLIAEEQGRLAGMIEVRGAGHVSMLFVDGDCQRRGVGRALLRAAFAPPPVGARRGAGRPPPAADLITVNAAPNSIAAYERLGFRPTGPEKTVKGLRFLPMARPRAGIARL